MSHKKESKENFDVRGMIKRSIAPHLERLLKAENIVDVNNLEYPEEGLMREANSQVDLAITATAFQIQAKQWEDHIWEKTRALLAQAKKEHDLDQFLDVELAYAKFLSFVGKPREAINYLDQVNIDFSSEKDFPLAFNKTLFAEDLLSDDHVEESEEVIAQVRADFPNPEVWKRYYTDLFLYLRAHHQKEELLRVLRDFEDQILYLYQNNLIQKEHVPSMEQLINSAKKAWLQCELDEGNLEQAEEILREIDNKYEYVEGALNIIEFLVNNETDAKVVGQRIGRLVRMLEENSYSDELEAQEENDRMRNLDPYGDIGSLGSKEVERETKFTFYFRLRKILQILSLLRYDDKYQRLIANYMYGGEKKSGLFYQFTRLRNRNFFDLQAGLIHFFASINDRDAVEEVFERPCEHEIVYPRQRLEPLEKYLAYYIQHDMTSILVKLDELDEPYFKLKIYQFASFTKLQKSLSLKNWRVEVQKLMDLQNAEQGKYRQSQKQSEVNDEENEDLSFGHAEVLISDIAKLAVLKKDEATLREALAHPLFSPEMSAELFRDIVFWLERGEELLFDSDRVAWKSFTSI